MTRCHIPEFWYHELEVWEECWRSAGFQWESYKGDIFRRNSKVFSGINDTELSAILTVDQHTMPRAWGSKALMASSAIVITLVRQRDIAHTQQNFTCEQVLAQDFEDGSPVLPPTSSYICCGKHISHHSHGAACSLASDWFTSLRMFAIISCLTTCTTEQHKMLLPTIPLAPVSSVALTQ